MVATAVVFLLLSLSFKLCVVVVVVVVVELFRFVACTYSIIAPSCGCVGSTHAQASSTAQVTRRRSTSAAYISGALR